MKRVHFAHMNTVVYSEDSRTPSPSLSVSSIPSTSSPELPTPPPEQEDDCHNLHAVYPVTPYSVLQQLDTFASETSTPTKAMQIHFLLAYTPYNDPAVHWDVAHPPPTSNVENPLQFHPLPFKTLMEPATSPALPSLTIHHPYIKWPIEVLPNENVPGAYVSVGDVFTTLYRELRLAIHPTEYAELEEGDIQQRVDAAYYSRCGRIRDGDVRRHEERKGIKKIDLLLGQTRFMGLSGTLKGPEVWELNVS